MKESLRMFFAVVNGTSKTWERIVLSTKRDNQDIKSSIVIAPSVEIFDLVTTNAGTII